LTPTWESHHWRGPSLTVRRERGQGMTSIERASIPVGRPEAREPNLGLRKTAQRKSQLKKGREGVKIWVLRREAKGATRALWSEKISMEEKNWEKGELGVREEREILDTRKWGPARSGRGKSATKERERVIRRQGPCSATRDSSRFQSESPKFDLKRRILLPQRHNSNRGRIRLKEVWSYKGRTPQ